MDLGGDTAQTLWCINGMYKKTLAAVRRALVRRDVNEDFKEDVGTSLKLSRTNCMQLFSIHYEESFFFIPLIHGDRAALAEPLIWSPSGVEGGS